MRLCDCWDLSYKGMATHTVVAYTAAETHSYTVQILDKAGYTRGGRVAVTQPRRVVRCFQRWTNCQAANSTLHLARGATNT